MDGCRLLALALIERTRIDGKGCGCNYNGTGPTKQSKSRASKLLREQSRLFVSGKIGDFDFWAHVADEEPEDLRKKLLAEMGNGRKEKYKGRVVTARRKEWTSAVS